MDGLKNIHDSDRVYSLIRGVDSITLAQELGGSPIGELPDNPTARLRVAAALALSDLLGDRSVDGLLRQLTSPDGSNLNGMALSAFQKWDAYLDALFNADTLPSIDDLLFYAGAGLIARQLSEVRATLRGIARYALDAHSTTAPAAAWPERVRTTVSLALLLLIRQESRKDVSAAGQAIDQLAEEQRQVESHWLDQQSHPQRDAVALLGYYHLAQAVARTAEFLLAGSVVDEEKLVLDIGPELRRLLSRADEFMSMSADIESQYWLNVITAILWTLRTDSIWVSGRGISERINHLLNELAKGERERQVFSLLPSQQDALRANLMDASRVAIVLQMPTSAGKTLLAEFAILQTLDAFGKDSRIVYVVPTRALATQTLRTLTEDLRPLGLDVMAAGSAFEEDPYELEILSRTSGIVIATPEKLDLLFRAHPEWFQNLRLIIVDEAHLLKDSERGVRLELLLANLRRERPEARLLLLTPFIENAAQIASWLGGARGLPITVQWRPSRLLLGLAELRATGGPANLLTHWKEPYRYQDELKTIQIPSDLPKSKLGTAENRVVFLARRLQHFGTVLALYSMSRTGAESAAKLVAAEREPIPASDRTPALRVAIAIAREEFGDESTLAFCLERGVAFHHSALSTMLRYLVEDQVRAGTIRFIAATTTLAQGMNFPVATVLIHSVHRPYGKGPLSSSEFWNIAGRAGRVGLVDKGLVLFADEKHREFWDRYAANLRERVQSALLGILGDLARALPLKEQYRRHEELRPFLQYLAHAAATSSPQRAMANLEELLQGSLANAQVETEAQGVILRNVARRYLQAIGDQGAGFLKVADTTGLGSFSFTELYAKIRDNPVLRAGPQAVMGQGERGIAQLVDALRWLPELSLAIGKGEGPMDVRAVARVVSGWLAGRRIVELADEFRAKDEETRVRRAATYVFSKVSQTISWGAHAYLRGWGLNQPADSGWQQSDEAMLPAYIQYGVHTPEAVVASLLSVPRQLAEPIGRIYRDERGRLTPGSAPNFRTYLENADESVWARAASDSPLSGRASAADLRSVWRQMQGLNNS